MFDGSLLIGRPVTLAGFPEVTDQELSRQPVVQPMIKFGHISCVDSNLELAAATYQEGRDIAIATSQQLELLYMMICKVAMGCPFSATPICSCTV